MSSMLTRALGFGVMMASVAGAATLTTDQRDWYRSRLGLASAPPQASTVAVDPVAEALIRWNRLRQTDSLAFSEYAGFLLAYPGWPGESAMRRTAEKQLDAYPAAPSEVARFFDRFPPLSNVGRLRQAEALAAIGRVGEATTIARTAWTSGALIDSDEQRLLGRFGPQITQADHDMRMDRLLWDRATTAAARQLPRVSPVKAALFDARLAMQTKRADAAEKAMTFASTGNSDAGFVADRARWLRDTGQSVLARAWLGQARTLSAPPLDPAKWLEILVLNARGAANDNQSTFVVDMARHADAAFPAGTVVRTRSFAERDEYTDLVWLGGITALRKLNRPADAAAMFSRYAAAAQSPGTQTKGLYWAGRAALAAGDQPNATRYFTEAATHPDQFYGQLAAERIGRPAAVPAIAPTMLTSADRARFASRSIVRASRILGELGSWRDQSLFLRTLAQDARSDADHALTAELSREIGRPDLGVMVARNARNTGASDFVPTGFPQVAVPPTETGNWVMIHAITRQESQFDRQAVSHAGARGLMQLMPATAREQAGKLGLSYDYDRLTSDPTYNIMLGSSFFQRMLNYYGGNHVLAVASYNAGPGNVNKWLRAYGDPRMPGIDVIDWIEGIPLSETRGYVQRVLENAVVYSAMNPQHAKMPTRNKLSAYLGKSTPG
ncbi:lytic transglycosylase domain-containing protein [Sphingomonas sp. KC8]|uniref:lytic transglycosylase domain-containing protein n=1 Tax=Sphingomonas sp. KC8 TaxID=1030157 RepID=UPI0002488EB9|nr:lytic transglycosylase domain-containing protein [Sphingomonas sp. KC8]ARS25763.1 lytic transglycosylase subunit [Sphingomonas sp. KC8]